MSGMKRGFESVKGRPECSFYQTGRCTLMRDKTHLSQFSHTCSFHPKCRKMADEDHMWMYDHGADRPAEASETVHKKTCSFFLQGICHLCDDPEHLRQYNHGEEPDIQPAYAFDCEFIACETQDKGWKKTKLRWPVSIGLVDNGMETLISARIRKPIGSIVTDDRFSRIGSGIRSDWDHGLERDEVSKMVSQLVAGKKSSEQHGALVGWAITNDLVALGYTDAAEQVEKGDRKNLALLGGNVCDIVELQDFFRTRLKDSPARLKEAFRAVFKRDAHAHDACEDAKMTMELYLAWQNQGSPPVRYETHEVILTVKAVARDGGLTCDVSHPFDAESESGKEQLKCLSNGAMILLREDTSTWLTQKKGDKLRPGWICFLRIWEGSYYLFTSRFQTFDTDNWDGLLEISDGVDARLQVVCGLSEFVEPAGFKAQKKCIHGCGEVLKERMVKNEKGRVEKWVQVSSAEGQPSPQWQTSEAAGWIKIVPETPIRLIRPFLLDLYMYNVQYEDFPKDAVESLKLLLLLKPGTMDVTEDIAEKKQEVDEHGNVRKYHVTFRERATRDAYWRTIRDRLTVSQIPGYQDRFQLTSPDKWTCAAHIVDQPR